MDEVERRGWMGGVDRVDEVEWTGWMRWSGQGG